MIRIAVPLLAGLLAELPVSADPTPLRGTDVALVGREDVCRVRLVVELDGKPAEEVWAEGFAGLFTYFDWDGNGHLDHVEAARLPAPAVLRQLLWGHVMPTPGGGPLWEDLDADRNGKVTRAELEAFYRPRGFGSVVFATARPGVPQKQSDALWTKLDTNGDGKLSEGELAATPKVLLALDANGDELVSAAELCPGLRYPGGAPTLIAESVATATADLDRKKPSLVPLLRSEGHEKPVETWTVRLGTRSGGKPSLERGSERGERLVSIGPDGRHSVRVDPDPRAAGQVADASKAVRRTFAESDGNADGALDAVELEKPAALGMKFLLPFADRNHDGKLARAELDGWLDLQTVLVKGAVVVGVTDLGRGLFELIDSDRDGTLSVRELRSAVTQVRAAGALKDGVVVDSQLPHHAVVVVGRGRPLPEFAVPNRNGPEWFRAMDRNGDGDVSAAEFLGRAAEFKRLDADGDGLLSPDEATREAPRK